MNSAKRENIKKQHYLNRVHTLKALLFIFCMSLVIFGMMAGGQEAFASDNPTAMLKGVTERVMKVLKENRDELQKNQNRIYGIVNQYIVPHVDFAEMGRWVVGRNAWNKASPAQQQNFVKEFSGMVVRSYAKSLLAFTDQTIEFLPSRSAGSQGRTQVSSVIKGGPRGDIHIDYRLIQTANGWKVYDIVIEGVSLAQGYHAQFSEKLKSGGIDAVVHSMQQHNGGASGKTASPAHTKTKNASKNERVQ